VESNYFLRILDDKDGLEIKIFNVKESFAICSTFNEQQQYLSKEYMIAIINFYKCVPIPIEIYNYLSKNINSIKVTNKKDFIIQYGLEEYFI
jgi:hypothetical protein